MKKILTCILPVLSIFSMNGQNVFSNPLYSINDSNIVEIGTYFEVDRVEEETLVLVKESELNMVIEAGREVTLLNPTPSFPSDGPYGTDDIEAPKYVASYIAYPFDGKVLRKIVLKNDITSLINVISILEKEADSFYDYFDCNYSLQDKNNLIIEYIRSMNKNYAGTNEFLPTDNEWGYIAGEDTNLDLFTLFINYVSSGGIEIREYFASFLDSNQYNFIMGAISPEFYEAKLSLLLGTENQIEIDLIHMFASLDAIATNTVHSSVIYPILNQYKCGALSSWVGDLQSFASEMLGKNLSNFDIVTDMLEPIDDFGVLSTSTFMYDDFYADVFATLLGQNLNLATTNFLSQFLFINFNNLINSNIYNLFYNYIINSFDSDFSNGYQRFKDIVYKMLNLNYDGVNSATSNVVSFSFLDYTRELPFTAIVDIESAILYRKLYGNDSQENMLLRCEIVNSFVDYIFERI